MPRRLSMAPGELRNYILQNEGKKTLYQMHKETGINTLTILKYAGEMNVDVRMDDKDDEYARIENCILDNPKLAASEIAALLGVSVGKVSYRARRLGIDIKTAPLKAVPKVRIEPPGNLFNVFSRDNWLV